MAANKHYFTNKPSHQTEMVWMTTYLTGWNA